MTYSNQWPWACGSGVSSTRTRRWPSPPFAATRTRMFGSAPLSSAWPDACRLDGDQFVAEALHVGGIEDRSAGGDDRAGLRALRGHVQPVAVPAIVRVGELTAVDPDLEASELDRRRLDGCAGWLRHASSLSDPVPGPHSA